MPEETRNIYKSARRSAGLTQEAAAERLGVSVESVRAYETEQRIPPNDIVERMVVCYNTQYLAYQHLHETNELMARVVPELHQRPVTQTVVALINAINRFSKTNSAERLLEIVEDGKVDETEMQDVQEIAQLLKKLTACAMELDFIVREKEETV